MKSTFFKACSVAIATGALVFLLTPYDISAQTTVSASAINCKEVSDRAVALRYKNTQISLSDFSILLAADQKNTLSLRNIKLLEGACAEHAYAFRMPNLEFNDGAVFSLKSNGEFAYSPKLKGLTNFWGGPPSPTHPEIKRAQFIMSSKVDGAFDKRSLDIGLWKMGNDFVIAAFVRQEDEFSEPVELIRSRHPIRSVTFFPSPDSNTGTLGMIGESESGIALISVDWNHSAMSSTLKSEKE
jgi:hypothetical protein